MIRTLLLLAACSTVSVAQSFFPYLGVHYDCCYDYELEVTYGDYQVHCGTHVPYSLAHYSLEPPTIKFPQATAEFYTVAMVDPDALSAQDPGLREVRHYLVGNVPRDVLKYDGQFCEKDSILSAVLCKQPTRILSAFQNPAPPPATGYHRYVQFVYEQPSYLFFFPLNQTDILNFNVTAFASFYGLTGPVAANYFKTQYEPSGDYQQCGNSLEGPLPCESYGFHCFEENQFFYQCLPNPPCIFRPPPFYGPTVQGPGLFSENTPPKPDAFMAQHQPENQSPYYKFEAN